MNTEMGHRTLQLTGTEHTTTIGGQRLFLWTKQAYGPTRGTILFVHGSSVASQCSFDLQVPGRPEASMMNWFSTRGFETWCLDCRGYGRSYKGSEVLATVSDGADDIAAASEYILGQSGKSALFLYGVSGGALRAALFAARFPERVSRLALDAMVWTGAGSRTLEERRKRLADWNRAARRPIDRASLESIFTRDHVGSAETDFVGPFIEQALALDSSVPNGTYIDMSANLPVVHPERINVPILVLRGQYDGIASLDDLLAFFRALPNPDKELAVIPGVAHASTMSKNFRTVYHVLFSFFTRPRLEYLE